MSKPALSALPSVPTHTVGSRGDLAWVLQALIPFIAFTFAVLAIKPELLRPLFPAGAFLVGYRLLKRNDSYYLSFLLWIYMLTPLLRRLVDWRVSYQDQSMILIAPLLVTLLPALELRCRLMAAPSIIRNGAVLALSGILFGTGVGMIKHPGLSVILATTAWSAPIVLCIFAASIREREVLSRVLTSTLIWGLLIMSAYGTYQFVVAPPWDTYWLKQISANSVAPSFGQPSAFRIRVWSTMNAPGPFAVWLGAAVVWISTLDGILPALAVITGYVALSLTLVRAAWMQTILALLIIACCGRVRHRVRNTLAPIFILMLLAFSFLHVAQLAGIRDRLKTLSSLGSDGSVNEREAMYTYMNALILVTPSGAGLESLADVHGYPIDSSLVQLFYLLGWLGAVSYLIGLSYLLANIALNLRSYSRGKVAAGSIALAAATQVFTGDILYRQGGVILWLFVGIWAAFSFSPSRPLLVQRGSCWRTDKKSLVGSPLISR